MCNFSKSLDYTDYTVRNQGYPLAYFQYTSWLTVKIKERCARTTRRPVLLYDKLRGTIANSTLLKRIQYCLTPSIKCDNMAIFRKLTIASFKVLLDHSNLYVPCGGVGIILSPCCNGTGHSRILMALAHTRVSGRSCRWHAVVTVPHCADKNQNIEGWNSAEIGTPELIESEGNLQELAVKSVWSLSCWAEIRVRGQCVRYLAFPICRAV